MGNLIKLDNVSWAYARSGEWALKNISLDIGEGEFIAVMGKNGSGKSTICRLINGLIPHSIPGTLLGTVTIDGTVTSSSTVAQLAKKAGMVFEDPRTQVFTASIYDELAFAPENLLFTPDEIKEKINWALQITGLYEQKHSPPAQLSGGQKQRLAIAAALVMADKILVLDEPVSQLDSAGTEEVLSFIREFCTKKGLSVVMAVCSGEEAAEFADKICVLKDGYLAAFADRREIFSDKKLIDLTGILPPQVSEFASLMSDRGYALPDFPINTQEAVASALKWYKSK